MTEKRYGMVIDTQHCVGCQTCTVSCKISNEVPGSAHWNHLESLDGDVLYQSTGTFPRTTLAFRPLLCNHCENPACVNNCPSGAMHKDPATGIVSVNQDVCIACGYCSWVCPYGAPSMNDVDHVMSGRGRRAVLRGRVSGERARVRRLERSGERAEQAHARAACRTVPAGGRHASVGLLYIGKRG